MVFAKPILRIACVGSRARHAVAHGNATNRIDALLRCWAFYGWIAERHTSARCGIAGIAPRAHDADAIRGSAGAGHEVTNHIREGFTSDIAGKTRARRDALALCT